MRTSRAIPFVEFYNPAANTLNLARFWELSQKSNSGALVRATRTRSEIIPMGALLPRIHERNRLGAGANLVPVLAPLAPSTRARKAGRIPAPKKLRVQLAVGSVSRASKSAHLVNSGETSITVPAWTDDRFVTVGTIKALAERPNDVMLENRGGEWHIVADDERVDMSDASRVFKLGEVQIHS